MREELEKEVKLKLGFQIVLELLIGSLTGGKMRPPIGRKSIENPSKLETLNQMQKELAKGEVAQAKVEELLKFGMTLNDLE